MEKPDKTFALRTISWPRALVLRIGRYFRRSRMLRFEKLLAVTPETKVLDVGGMDATWELAKAQPRVLMTNLTAGRVQGRRFPLVVGDGCALPFASQSLDIVFSNSVLEHVGDWGNQERFAKEVARVGRRYWVQTPNRWFPIEAHVWTPMFQFFPQSLKQRVLRYTIRSLIERLPEEQNQEILAVRLLDFRQMQQLFPDAIILRERFAGLTKSLVAVKG